jgi:hypothetical protein
MHEIIIGHKIQDKKPNTKTDYTREISEFRKNKNPKIVLLHQTGCHVCETLEWDKMKDGIHGIKDPKLMIFEIENEYISHKGETGDSKIKLKTDIIGYPTILYIDEKQNETEVERNKVVEFLLKRKRHHKTRRRHTNHNLSRKHKIRYPDISLELLQIKKLVAYIESKLSSAI